MNILNYKKRKKQNNNDFSRKHCFLTNAILYLNTQEKKSLP